MFLKRKIIIDSLIPLSLLILPWIFFGIGVDVFHIALAPGDGLIFGLPTKVFSGKFELWNPLIESGTFTIKDVQNQALYLPGVLIMKVFPTSFGYNLLLLLHYTIAGYFTYLFLRKIKLNAFPSYIGGVLFMFCGFMGAHKGHHAMVMTAAYLPVILYFFESYISKKEIKYLFAACLSFSMSIFADYTAVSMYIGMVIFPYVFFRNIILKENEGLSFIRKIWTPIWNSIIIFGCGLLIASPQVLPIIESLKYINRGSITYSFFTQYFFEWKYFPLILFPYLWGHNPPTWNLAEITGYMGILPILFSFLALILYRKENRQINYWFCIAIFSFILTLGDQTPLYKLMYYVPGYNMFRVPARNWLNVDFSIAVLSAIFLHHILNDKLIQKAKFFKIIFHLAILLLGCVFLVIVPFRWIINHSEEFNKWSENMRLSSPNVFIPLIIICLSIIIMIHFYYFKQNRFFLAIMSILIFFDLFSFGHYHDTNYGKLASEINQNPEIVDFLSEHDPQKNDYRVLSLNLSNLEKTIFPEINMLYGFNTINGYGPIWLKDYTQLTGFDTDGIVSNNNDYIKNSQIYSILSVKYLITDNQVDKLNLETQLASKNQSSRLIIANNLSTKNWGSVNASIDDHGVAELSSQSSDQYSLIQSPFEIQPSKFYRVSFTLQNIDSPSNIGPIYVDFYDVENSKEMAGFDAYVDRTSIGTEKYQNFQFYFPSGNIKSKNIFLRFFTYSTSTFNIKEISLEEMNSLFLWGSSSNSNPVVLYKKIYETGDGIEVYENQNFLPRSRFVTKIISVENSTEAIHNLKYNYFFNPSTTAFVEGYDGTNEFKNGEIISTDYSNFSKITLHVKTYGPSFLILSDTWYPGWKAYVNGEETRIYKTNGCLRGINISGDGDSTVEFVFEPISLILGIVISGIILIVFIIICLFHNQIRKRMAQFSNKTFRFN